MNKTYYKVVRRFNKSFVSCAIAGDFKVEYKIGQRTYPKINNSKLFVFDTFNNAMSFRYGFQTFNVVVLECKALISDADLLIIPFLSSNFKEKKYFWDSIKEKKKYSLENFHVIPDGTLAAGWIEPIKIA